jgi:hypothetical protein
MTTTTIQTPETNTTQLIATLIADSVTGTHRINGKFVRAKATVTRGIITLTIQQVEFDTDDKAVQVVLQLTPPATITPTTPELSPSALETPAVSTAVMARNGGAHHQPPDHQAASA